MTHISQVVTAYVLHINFRWSFVYRNLRRKVDTYNIDEYH